MSIALDQAINYRSKYALTVDSKTLTPKKNKGYSRSRNMFSKVVNVFLVLSIMAIALFGTSGGNFQKAYAANVPTLFGVDICDMMNTNGAWFNQASTVYMGAIGTQPESGKITAYEKFGTAGTDWTVWRGPTEEGKGKEPFKTSAYNSENPYHANGMCMPMPEVLTASIGIGIFQVAKITVFISGLVYQTAFEGKDSAIVPMQEQIGKIITGDPGAHNGLKDSLFLDFLVPIIMLAALYLGYIGLVKRRSTEAMSSAVWMIGAAIVGLYLLINPMLIPNATNSVVKNVTGAIMTGITSSSTDKLGGVGGTASKPSTLCAVDAAGAPTEKNSNPQQRNITRTVQCSLWYSFIYVPWATGQYGVSPLSVNPADQKMLTQFSEKMKEPISLDASGSGHNIENPNWPIYQINAQVLPSGKTVLDRDKLWVAVPQAMLGEPGAGKGGVVNSSWKGDPSGGLIAKALFSLIAAFGSGLMIVTLGMSMIVFEIGLIILMLLAPLFLLVGVHPGFGRRIALKWLETIISLTMKRIILSVLLGVMITFYSIAIAIPESKLPWFGTIILIVAISIAGMKYKDTLTDMFGDINLGGGGPIKEPESKMGAATKGALAAGTGAVIGSVLAGRASSTASVVNSGKAGENSRRDGTGGAATQRAKGSETLENVEGMGGAGPSMDPAGSSDDSKSGPATSRAEPDFDSSDQDSGDSTGNEKTSGGATPLPKRSEARAAEAQKAGLAAAAEKRQALEERLNKKFAKTSSTARAGANFRTISGAMVKGAFMGASGGDVSFIAQTAQMNAGKSKANQRKGVNSNIKEAKMRQSEYTSAWDAYNSATSEEEKNAAAKKIKSTYGEMTGKERSYLKGVGKVNQQVDKAMGLPKKPASPASSTDRKVAPERRHVNPNHNGGLPRRPQP
jgi:hypothetical protein